MNPWIYELKTFYGSRAGRLVRRILSTHIRDFWPDTVGLRVMGVGYALPYLPLFREQADRVFNVMPATGGAHFWPDGEKGQVCMAAEDALPFETESVDRILMVHNLEHAEMPTAMMQEIWRVLKSNGRLLMIVPNRLGFWARADWTPFGLGRPYTSAQIANLMTENLFVRERWDRALFMPPFRSFLVLRAAYGMENFGKFMFPGLSGVHLVEAGKQIYAGVGGGRKQAALAAGGRRVVAVKPQPA